MANVASVTFKIPPEYCTALKAMAAGQGKSLSEFVRETVEAALDLEAQVRRLAAFCAGAGEEPR